MKMASEETVPALSDEKLQTGFKSSQEAEKEQNGDLTTQSRNATSKITVDMVLRTVAIIMAYLIMGMFLEIIGPTLPDLMQRVSCNFEEISRALVIHSAGYLLSCISGGVLTDRFSRHVQAFLSAAFLLAAVGTVLAPWVSRLDVLCLLVLCRGLSQGSIDTYCNFLCMKIWQSRAAVPIHMLHFSFGIGAFIIPQIARPFLGEKQVYYNESQRAYMDRRDVQNTTIGDSYMNDTQMDPREPDLVNMWQSRIEVPYTICAALAGVMCLTFFLFYLRDRNKPENPEQLAYARNMQSQTLYVSITTLNKLDHETDRQPSPPKKSRVMSILSPGSCTNGNPIFGIQFFSLLFLFTFNLVGCDNTVGRFIYSFATESELDFSVNEAAALNSVYWICFTCARGTTIFIAKWVHPRTMLIAETCLNVTCAIVLVACGNSSRLVVWIFLGLLGASLSPVLPTCLAWANRYVVMKGVSIAILFAGGAAGGMFYQWMTGYLFLNYGPHVFMYVILGYAVVLAVLVALMLLLVCRRPERFAAAAAGEINVRDCDVMDEKSSEILKMDV